MNKTKVKVAKESMAKIKKIFSKVEIVTCTMCGAFLTSKEAKENEGVCTKHWDY